jgi:hypothetical protein
MKRTQRISCGLTLSTVVVLMAAGSLAMAQKPFRPNMYDRWGQNRSQRSMRHARDYSRDLYSYCREVKKVQPEVVTAESEKIGSNIVASQKELSAVRKAAAGDQATLATLEAIEKQLAKAAEIHKTLHAECGKDQIDSGVCGHCCSEITKELEKAMADHAALMRKIELHEPNEVLDTK